MDSSTYENLRNLTLLFFIEKLVEKPTRSLHDLSCQFGSKGFSREMRQIAGGSQSGLKKFLASYPSIFTVDSDNVTYTTTAPQAKDARSSNLDYNTQAVEYFRSRLIQYGIGVQVPIKSLLGHRSQASPQVRHISGQHIKEFTSFLATNPAVFKIIDESVLLVEFENQPGMPVSEYNESIGGINMKVDKSIICKYITFFGDILGKHGPLLVDQLLVGIGNQFPECSELFKSVQDLNVFLKFHPQCFSVHSNLVTLTDSYHIALEHLQRQSAEAVIINNNNNNNNTIANNNEDISLSDCPFPSVLFTEKPENTEKTEKPEKTEKSEKPEKDKSTFTPSIIPPLMTSKFQNAPLKPMDQGQPQPLIPPLMRSNSNLGSKKTSTEITSNASLKSENKTENEREKTAGSGGSGGKATLVKRESSSLSQRLNSIVMKTLTENVSRDYNLKQKDQINTNNENVLDLMSLCNSQPTEGNLESLKNFIVNKTSVVANVRKCKVIIDEMINVGAPISVDCEGVNLGQNGSVTLLQLCNQRGSVFIFDLMSEPRMASVVQELLAAEGVVKIMHDCRNDSVNLHNQFGIQLQNVFDTQAAHVVVEMNEGNGKTESKVKNTSLNGLCQVYGVPYNPLKDKVKSVYRHDQKYWSRRPLTKQMIAYAACDVLILPSLHTKLHPKLKDDQQNKDLFIDLCNENIMCHISSEEIKSRRRMRKNNADLMELRAKLDSATPANLVLSNREMRLLKHLELSAADKEKLSSSIKVARKLEKLSSRYESSSESNDNESNPPSLDNTLNMSLQLSDEMDPYGTNVGHSQGSYGPDSFEGHHHHHSHHHHHHTGSQRQMDLDTLDAIVTSLLATEASTQTVITMEILDKLGVELPQVE